MGQSVEQTENDNGGESKDHCVCVCVLLGLRDNGKAERKSRERGDQVASAVGNDDDWGRLEADKGVQR